MTTENKLIKLEKILCDMESVLIGYSGGVDSTFLATTAHDVLGDRAIAVTARSETYPLKEYIEATRIAEDQGFRHLTIHTEELKYPGFSANPENRCYYCKKELFSRLKIVADENHITYLADGSNVDDQADYRPGFQALRELGVRSPLMEAGLTKDDIRTLSAKMGLATWDKPAYACLSSRFPYGTEITLDKLGMVEKAENFLHEIGIRQVRVRHHDTIARIEVEISQISNIVSTPIREKILNNFKKIGYKYVTLDIQGYRTGSMNEVLNTVDQEST